MRAAAFIQLRLSIGGAVAGTATVYAALPGAGAGGADIIRSG